MTNPLYKEIEICEGCEMPEIIIKRDQHYTCSDWVITTQGNEKEFVRYCISFSDKNFKPFWEFKNGGKAIVYNWLKPLDAEEAKQYARDLLKDEIEENYGKAYDEGARKVSLPLSSPDKQTFIKSLLNQTK